jgi:dinuclear metal center YbgI/SA1388 family protein
MSVKCSEVIKLMESYAPPRLAEDWDNVGLLVGESERSISKILVALDATDAVIDEAIAVGADLIVTHHPFIFKAQKSITDCTPLGKKIIKLIKNDIAVYSAHTNLDSAGGGTNATLAELLGLKDVEGLADIVPEDNAAMGRIGNLDKPVSFSDFVKTVKAVLGAEVLSVSGDLDKTVSRVGICTGKGAGYMAIAKAMGADAYITGDFGYHEGQTAEDLELCVIDGTHYLTEVIVVPVVGKYLSDNLKAVEVVLSKTDAQTLKFV